MGLRSMLDSAAPHFEKGGKFEKMYPLYEAIDTGLYSPPNVTNNTSHVRDGIDLKRIMITVWMCTFPAMFFGMYNIGLQANDAIAALSACEKTAHKASRWHSCPERRTLVFEKPVFPQGEAAVCAAQTLGCQDRPVE